MQKSSVSKNTVILLMSMIFLQPNLMAKPKILKHVAIYQETGRFGGWPANFGIWSWGDEILVGFARGYFKDLGPERHNIDREKPEDHIFARSLDGGHTWMLEDPAKDGVLIARGGALHGVEPTKEYKEITKLEKPIDFSHPNLVMTFRMLDVHIGPSLFYYSYNRGKSWDGPFSLLVGDFTKISARTDYIITSPKSCFAFLTAAKSNDKEGRPFCAETNDGGLSWKMRSWIGPEPKSGFSIMPSTVSITDDVYLTTLRCREGDQRWIESYLSTNACKSWEYMGKPVKDLGEGNPPSLIKLRDGQLCLTYGYRAEPFGIYAKFSSDNGKTWSKAATLRDDGAGRDIGYVRSVQLPNENIVTIYYFQDNLAPERYVAATIWKP